MVVNKVTCWQFARREVRNWVSAVDQAINEQLFVDLPYKLRVTHPRLSESVEEIVGRDALRL